MSSYNLPGLLLNIIVWSDLANWVCIIKIS